MPKILKLLFGTIAFEDIPPEFKFHIYKTQGEFTLGFNSY